MFPSLVGTEQDAHNVRRMFRDALTTTKVVDGKKVETPLVPGVVPDEWVPYELRHSFVSNLSERGMPVEEISRLMGHKGTAVTELVYRHQLRPVIESGASLMDSVFPLSTDDTDEDTKDEEDNDDDAA